MADNTNSNNSTQQRSSGLSKSTPLVTVQNVHSGVKTAVTAASNRDTNIHHPLATPPAAAAGNASTAAVGPSDTTTPFTAMKKIPSPTVAKIPSSSASSSMMSTSSPSPASSSAATIKKPSSSLEEMADDFLSQPSLRTEQNLPPLVKPPALPKEQEGMERLQTLVLRRAWGDVLSVCGQMLRGVESSYTRLYSSLVSSSHEDVNEVQDYTNEEQRDVVEILTLECHAWLKLRRYNELGREVDKWNFVGSGMGANAPSWVPWSLHILAAESFQYTDPSSSQCTDALFSLRERLVEKKEYMWLMSVDNALTNAFIRRKEWRLACAALDNIMTNIPNTIKEWVESGNTVNDDVDSMITAFQCEVLSRQGRIMLQIGALNEAAVLFEECKTNFYKISTTDKSHWIFQYIAIQIRIHDGLLTFAHSQYNVSMTHFRKSIELLQVHADSQEYNKEDWMGPTILRGDAYQTSLAHCWNNLALCALYTCRMQDAVRMMESLVRQNPTYFLTERLAFNLSTLYELGGDAAASTRKKRILQIIAKRFFLHDIGPESFRVN